MFMANQKPAELPEPCIGSFHDPASFVTSQLPSIVITPFLIVLPIRSDQLDGSLLQPFTQGIGVVSAIRYDAFELLPRTAFSARDTDFLERGFRKRNFCRRGTFQPNSQRKTLTVDQYHPLRSLAALGFTDSFAPFFAGAKLPSRNASSHLSRLSSSSAPSRARHAFNHTSCFCHCMSRRQQVDGEGNLSGRNRHAAPVCRTQRIPSKQARFEAQGRPRLSRLRFGSGSRGSISFHWSSVNSSCRFFMTEAQQITSASRKYLS